MTNNSKKKVDDGIELQQGAILTLASGSFVLIDQEDYERASQLKWRMVVCKKGRRRLRILSSMKVKGRRKTISLERFLACPRPGQIAYALRAEELDYRKMYILCCNYQDRQRCLSKRKNKTTSQYKGVSFLTRVSKWRAAIQVDGKSINLGDFSYEWQAALAYNMAAVKYFGDRCFLNQIQSSESAFGGWKK
jgi:hypothetical protein